LRKCKQAVYSTPGRRHLHLLEELEGSVALLFPPGSLQYCMTKPRWQQLQVMLQFFADLVREKAYLTPCHLRQQKPSREMQKGWDS
jgi:hypothetical protein